MNRKDTNHLIGFVIIVSSLLIMNNTINIGIKSPLVDICVLVLIVLLSKKYLKGSILISLLYMLIKFNNTKEERFTTDDAKEAGDADVDEDADEKKDDEDADEKKDDEDADEKKDDEDADEKKDDEDEDEDEDADEKKHAGAKKANAEAHKHDHKHSKKDQTKIYENDCMRSCGGHYDKKECVKICGRICPNPVKYQRDLKELNRLRKIIEQLDHNDD